jgi:hypothetical protein
MRLIYADAGLRTNAGHHASVCRSILRHLKARGVDAAVFGHAQMEPALRDDLRATPLLRHSPHTNVGGDPICGWLDAFDLGTRLTREDLTRLPVLGPDDIFFFCTVSPPLLMGTVLWLTSLPAGQRPHVVLDLGTDSGLERTPDGAITPRDPRIDPRASFYRFAAARIPKDVAGRLHLYYCDDGIAEVFSGLMNFPVRGMPMLYEAAGELQSRVGRKPVTIAMLGHQMRVKGYQFAPEIVRALLKHSGDCRILVHNGVPERMPETHGVIRSIAASDPRVTIEENAASLEHWVKLLRSADLVLCPYDPQYYGLMPSGLATEAVANAIPVVGPAATTIGRLIADSGGCGTTFEKFEAQSVIAAAKKALDNFDTYAGAAFTAAQRWAAHGGPRGAVELILASTKS